MYAINLSADVLHLVLMGNGFKNFFFDRDPALSLIQTASSLAISKFGDFHVWNPNNLFLYSGIGLSGSAMEDLFLNHKPLPAAIKFLMSMASHAAYFNSQSEENFRENPVLVNVCMSFCIAVMSGIGCAFGDVVSHEIKDHSARISSAARSCFQAAWDFPYKLATLRNRSIHGQLTV